MIGSHLFATVLVAILAAVSSNAEVVVPTECPRIDPLNTTIHIAHEWDCTRFYTCSNGRKILTTCADRDLKGGRLYFDPVLQVCVWPEDSTCGKNGTITSVSTEGSTSRSGSESGNTNSTVNSTTESSSESENTNSTGSSTTESSSASGNTNSTESSTTESSSESGNTNSTVNSTTKSSSESGNTNSTGSSTTESSSESGNTNSTESSTTESSSESGNTNSTVNSTTESSSESGNMNSTESSTTESSSESGNTNSTVNSTTESSSESGNTNSTESSTTESSSESGNTNSTESSTTESSSGPGITETTVPSQCPAENEGYAVHIAHESECGLFYQCDWGKKVLKECPGGLHFNSILQVCDWPESAGCSLNGSVDANRTNSTDSEISTTKITSTTAKSDNLTVSTTSSVVGPCERSGACPSVDPLKSAVLLAHEDCTKFCICSNGTPYLFECPGSLYFNDELKVCDWPETSGCVQTT